MILRETATRTSHANISPAQGSRSKPATSKQDDADCFQRLANCENLSLEAEKNEASVQVEPISSVGFAAPVLAMLSLQPAIQRPRNENFVTGYYETTIPQPVPHMTKATLKKPALNAINLAEATEQKHGGLTQKSVSELRGNLDIQTQKAALKVDTPSRESIVENFNHTAFNPLGFATALIPQNMTQVRTATVNLTELPHVMHVQIDHIKRNSESVLTSLELVLEPAELGRITARIQYEEGRVTLVLSAEHKHIANDLARDGGLLLRVLSDQIPGINKMAIFVQTEAQQSNPSQGQLFGDLHSSSREQKQQSGLREANNWSAPDVSNDDRTLEINATALKVRI